MAAYTFPRRYGRRNNRTCTDIKCAIFWLICFAGMVGCVVWGTFKGSTIRVGHGQDWEGRVCGKAETVMVEQPAGAAATELTYDFTALPLMMFCGSSERTGTFPKYMIEGSTVCVKSCPVADELPLQCLMPAFHNFTAYQGGVIGGATNVETLEMTLTQSVVKQKSYPTSLYGGQFCLPDPTTDVGKELRNLLLDGTWGSFYRPYVTILSISHAWPLFIIAAGLALILGVVYLMLMDRCAGPLIFFTMMISALLCLAAGLVFFFAIVMDTNDPTADYMKFNPIASMYQGTELKIYSCVTGVILLIVAVIMGALTCSSLKHIDECVGLLDASMECCIRGQGGDKGGCRGYAISMTLFAIMAAASTIAVVGFLVGWCLPRVASLGNLGYSEITINGSPISGLQRVWLRDGWETAAFYFFFVMMIWFCEFWIQLGHYVLAYTVACWYFIEVEEKKENKGKILSAALGGKNNTKQVQVRVAGIDNWHGQREGMQVGEDGKKYLVVPVEKKGPGIGRNDLVEWTYVKPRSPNLCMDMLPGVTTGLWYHFGTIARGAPVIFFMRPFRMVSQCVQGFLFRIADPEYGQAYSADPHNANIKGCLSLLSACLDHSFGKYNKTAFTELVLNGGGYQQDGCLAGATMGFFECTEGAFNFLVRSGGSIAHLYGSMVLYEMFGTAAISIFCTWTCWVVQCKVDWFNIVDGQKGQFYVEDKDASLIACGIVSGLVAFFFMSMWDQTADVLLYCVAWNRRQCHEGEEYHVMPEGERCHAPEKYCPMAMRNILPWYELEPEAEHGLHAHGLGQQGAILAAMEHGAMNPVGSSAPDYSKAVANTHLMATRMAYG